MARSTRFCSSRSLPGQSYVENAFIALLQVSNIILLLPGFPEAFEEIFRKLHDDLPGITVLCSGQPYSGLLIVQDGPGRRMQGELTIGVERLVK
jgi:hypothetical protein